MPQKIIRTADTYGLGLAVSGNALGGIVPIGNIHIDVYEVNTVKQAVQQFISSYLIHLCCPLAGGFSPQRYSSISQLTESPSQAVCYATSEVIPHPVRLPAA
jgi:hypothetical protein